MQVISLGVFLGIACAASSCAAPDRPVAVASRGQPPVAAPGTLAGEAIGLAFHSAFWTNLHHVLYAEAWARRGDARRKLAGAFPAPLETTASRPLGDAERAAWDRAVAYYDRTFADRDLLFDDAMAGIRRALITAGGAHEPPAGLAPELRDVLAAAAPVYAAHWWQAHDRANRAWVTALINALLPLVPEVHERLAALYRTPWFDFHGVPVRVDVVFVGSWSGGYTSNDPAPGHVIFASSDSRDQGWAAAEMVLHETSHLLSDPIERAFAAATTARGLEPDGLWHAALFYLTGEVVRQALSRRGVAYTPYVYANGLFARGWDDYRVPLERDWQRYIDGESTLDEAVTRVVSALPAPAAH